MQTRGEGRASKVGSVVVALACTACLLPALALAQEPVAPVADDATPAAPVTDEAAPVVPVAAEAGAVADEVAPALPDAAGAAPAAPAGYEDPPPQASTSQPAAAPDAPPEPATRDARFIDANSDRILMTSTAATHPDGTFFFSNYDGLYTDGPLLLLQFGYAFTDRIQAAITGVPPMFEDQPYFFDISLKARVLDAGILRAAVLGALGAFFFVEGNGFWGARVGGVGQVCFTTSCWSSLSASVTTFLNDDTTDFLPIVFGAGAVLRVSSLVAFLFEPLYTLVIGNAASTTDQFLFSYAVRLSGPRWGVDIGFVRPFDEVGSNLLIMGFPMVAFTYRSGGRAPESAPGTTAAALFTPARP